MEILTLRNYVNGEWVEVKGGDVPAVEKPSPGANLEPDRDW